MKWIKLLMFCLVCAFTATNAVGQANASLNILTLQGGQVTLGGTVDIQVTLGNTGPVSSIGVNKVRAQISVPSALCSLLPNAQQTGLPPGWSITVNTGSAITVCNGSDVIPVGTQRTILIKVQGNTLGGPSTVNANLLFSSGTSCTTPGSLPGDNTADNSSTSSIEVINAVSCNLAATAAAGTIACNGGTTTITATATGAGGPVQYSINAGVDFQVSNIFTVPAGTYTVLVREDNNLTCSANSNAVTIANPAVVSAVASAPAISCFGGSSTLTVTASGGTGAYQYSLNGGAFQAGNTFSVNAAGSPYTVTVRDANLCTGTSNSVTLTQPTAVSASAAAGTIACFGGSTTLTVTANGGTGAYEYSINGGAFQPGNTFTVTAAGSPYTVTVRDANLCTATTSAVTVTQPTALSATASSTAVTTTGGSDGTATAVPAGGTAPYTYLWSPGGQTTVTATGLTAGSYTVTVTDFNGCTTTATTTVGSPACNISAAASAGSIACFGGTTTLTVTVTGATAPVQYSLNGGAFQLGNAFTVNAAGSPYTVSVKDANLCTATTNVVTVTQPSQLVASSTAGIAACGGTATVTVSATGGTTPYTGTGAFNAPAGPYTYTVTDANGCTSVTTGTVTSAADNINPTITAPANVAACTNSGCTATGVVLGTPVTADNCSVASVTNNAPAAFPLGVTTVTWTVTDGSGNTATATQTVTVTDGIAPSIYLNQTGLLAGNTGTSSSATPYLLPVKPGVKFTSILTAANTVGGYQMAGIPDGLGAFDNCNGTFTLLMNQEIGNTLGVVRSHGAIGSFVSKWIINKSTLSVVSGSDLMTSVYGWNSGTQSSNAGTLTYAFNRFCSGDLPAGTAFYNAATGLGTKARIYMHGEEGGATGYQLGTVASGADAGKAYILGKFNLSTNGSGLTGIGAWENALANPFAQNKTIVIGDNDGGTGIMNNSIAVYVGTKTNTGSEVDKAGLTNGTLSFVNVTGNPVEIVNTTTRATNITSGAAFTLSGTASTTFSRPEDGVWNPANPAQYFFVTTDQLDQVADGLGAQIGRSRLWRLNFADITNPALGGTIDLLLDGTEGHVMLDNLTADKTGHLILQEDVGNAAHNGKIWQYTIATDQLTQIAKHDPARFGDRVAGVTTAATAPFNADEESSGIIDASDILGAGWFLTSDQAHYTTGIPAAVVEGGQLLAVFNPESVGATSTAADTVRACFGSAVNLGTPATADNCSVASVTNNAPGSFPVGNTTVTWTVTDGSGNTATATQVVVITVCNNPLAATFVKTNLSACGGSNDGTITITATGGLAPYSYSWTGESGSNHTAFTAGNVSSLTGLNYGYYNVTITDANLNTVTLSNIHVEFAFAVFITASGSNTSSCGNTGSISLFGNSGVQPYTYSLDGITYQSANTFNGLAAGTYTGFVKDAAGCVSSKNNIVITASAQVTVTTFVRAATSCSNDGQIQVFRAGGIPPYTYSLDGITYQTSNVFNGLAAGSYTASVKDSKGCVGTQPAVVNQGAGISVNLGKTNTSSCTNDGTIQANAAGGVAPYTYSIDGTTFQPSNAFGSLGAGTYTITVKDTKGCLGTANITITVNQIIVTASVINASSCLTTNGSVQLFRTGGTGPYSYSINGNTYQSSPSFTGLTAGTYTGFVKDSKGCVGMLTGIVVGPSGCAPLIASGSSSKSSVKETAGNQVIRILAYPNPSANDFTLALEGFNAKEAISVTVTDLLGRIIYKTTGAAKLQYRFGGNFIAGMYNVQVVQGAASKTLKLVKE